MSVKKILIVTRFFYPDITPRAFRAFELAKEFALQGHEVTVLTTERNYNYDVIEQQHLIKVKAIVKKEPSINGGGIKRLIRFGLNYLFLYPFIMLMPSFKKALKEESGYDLLISIAYPYPVHFGVVKSIKQNKNLTKVWIADCGDPFAGEAEGRFSRPFYYKMIEKWFCKVPDYITIPIKEAKPAYNFICQRKIKVIPQGFNFDTIKPNYNPDMNSVPTFAYAGNLSPGLRDPRPLIEYLDSLNMDFKFIIYTKNKGFLESYKSKLKDKLEFREYVPRETLLKELGKMDFLINLENKNNIQKPSKLIDYALLERPILSIKPLDIDKKNVLEFLKGNYSKAEKISNIQDYNIKHIAKQFMNLYNDKIN